VVTYRTVNAIPGLARRLFSHSRPAGEWTDDASAPGVGGPMPGAFASF
jgi:hypothetical protein